MDLMDLMDLKDKVLKWFGTGRVGASSKAMALHIVGLESDGSHPCDPDDLSRCLLFLEAVPEARAELYRLATLSPVWAALTARWDELEALFNEEVVHEWGRSSRAPRTFRLMNEVITQGKMKTDTEMLDWLERNMCTLSHARAANSVFMDGMNVQGCLVNEARTNAGGPGTLNLKAPTIRELVWKAMEWKKENKKD